MSEIRTRVSLRRLGGRVAATAAATAVLVGASFALAPAALAAPGSIGAVSVAAPSTANQGDTITVTIPVDASEDLFAYDLVVTFDPALLDFDDASAAFPAGGFDTVTESADSVHLTNTRLGTSPGLSGAQNLASVTFTVLGGGTAAIQLASATFVDSAGASISLAAPVSATVTLTAAPVIVPSASPSVSASASPSPAASDGATADPAAVTATSGPLANTGSGLVIPLIAGAFAVALLALGSVLVIRRRKEIVR